jgi:hypothetical protein
MFCVSFDLCYKRLDTLAFLVICINCFVSKLREGKRFCLFSDSLFIFRDVTTKNIIIFTSVRT